MQTLHHGALEGELFVVLFYPFVQLLDVAQFEKLWMVLDQFLYFASVLGKAELQFRERVSPFLIQLPAAKVYPRVDDLIAVEAVQRLLRHSSGKALKLKCLVIGKLILVVDLYMVVSIDLGTQKWEALVHLPVD